MEEIEEVKGVHPLRAWLQTWDWLRLLRVLLGIALLVQGFKDHDWLAGGVGAFFALTALLNLGCGGGGCSSKGC